MPTASLATSSEITAWVKNIADEVKETRGTVVSVSPDTGYISIDFEEDPVFFIALSTTLLATIICNISLRDWEI